MATEFSPAKINLFLAVTGRREDGFHDLVSVAAPLDFGDELEADAGKGEGHRGKREGERRRETEGRGEETGGRTQAPGDGPVRSLGARGYDKVQFSLECDNPAVPADGTNLVLRAAEAFAAVTGFAGAVRFKLTKRIPLGAGLGGGSSNAVAALRALNALAERKLPDAELSAVAVTLGSDCPLFLRGAPVVMRGRGERVDSLPESAVLRLRGRRLLLFKPSLGIATPWAYARMVRRGRDYLAASEAEARLTEWVNAQLPAEDLLFNNMEPAAFEKYPALPLLLGKLRAECGVATAMSGSGSACFVLLPEGASAEAVTRLSQRIRECWGPPAWVRETRIA